ncbi:MAG: DnaJ C-terminal domain-containing protein [bacterium]|nr:DnaJ C-terminal domain-containing protein [bacterium]
MAVEFQDYYDILGVKKTASQKEIQKAYRKLAQKYHPDISKEADAANKFVKINEANEVLNNPESRKKYDQLGQNWKQNQDFQSNYQGTARDRAQQNNQSYDFHFGDSEGFSEFFEQMFGQQRANQSQRKRQAQQGLTKEATIKLTIIDLYIGVTKQISLESLEYGVDGEPHKTIKNYQLKIPAGTKHGSHIRLSGQGQPGTNGGKAGDLFLKVELIPDLRFRIKDFNLYTTVALYPWDLLIGSSVPITLPDGSNISITVPPKSKESTKLRIKEKGLPKNKIERGDLFIELEITMPSIISEKEEKLWKELKITHESDAKSNTGRSNG